MITNFLARQLSPKFFSFTNDNRATPVQDTAQQRHRRRHAAGTRSKVSFYIKTLRKLFFTVSCCSHPPDTQYNREGCWRYWHVAMSEYCTYLDTRGLLLRALFSPAYVIKTEYLRKCSASRVWPYMHQLWIMSLVKCWVYPAPVFSYLTFRSIG